MGFMTLRDLNYFLAGFKLLFRKSSKSAYRGEVVAPGGYWYGREEGEQRREQSKLTEAYGVAQRKAKLSQQAFSQGEWATDDRL